jgi:hemerythrin-like domain-containing protein
MSYLAKPNGQPNFDASEMLMMHDMLRREFALMPGVVGRVAAGDHDRTQIVGDHIKNVSTVLHQHHVLEDENVWPLLVDRCGTSVAPLVELMEDQHQRVASLIHQIDEALSTWRDSPTVTSRDALVEAFAPLITALAQHLGTEEHRIVPLMEQHITAAEWNDMISREAVHLHLQPDQLPAYVGMLMYEGDPHSVQQAIAILPKDTRLIVTQLAPQAFAAYSQQIHGTTTPPRSTEL